MLEVTLIGLITLLLLVPLGVTAWWGLLRLMDKAAGVDFRAQLEKMERPEIYFAGRAIAVAYLIGQLFSRYV